MPELTEAQARVLRAVAHEDPEALDGLDDAKRVDLFERGYLSERFWHISQAGLEALWAYEEEHDG